MSFDPISLALMKKQLPCYDTRKTAPLTIEWDGIEKEGQETFEIPNLIPKCAKLSDAVPTIEEVRAGSLVVEGGEEAGTYPNADNIEEATFGFSCNIFIFVPQTCSVGEYVFPAGVWGAVGDFSEAGFTKVTLQLPSVTTGELKTIDPKYYRKNLDLSSYVGQTANQALISAGMTTLDIGTAITFLAFNGGGEATLTGENITRFYDELSNTKSDISLTLQLGKIPYEMFPMTAGNREGEKKLGFTIPVQIDTTALVCILLFCRNESLDITVFVK